MGYTDVAFWPYGRIAGKLALSPFFSFPLGFPGWRKIAFAVLVLVAWMLRIGSARHLGPALEIELVDVGDWLANCDEALETEADFLAVTDHRLILTWAGSESKRLRAGNVASIWTPACQESAHVGHAGVGLVGLKRAPLVHSVPLYSEVQGICWSWRVQRCVVPVGGEEGGGAYCSSGCFLWVLRSGQQSALGYPSRLLFRKGVAF